MRNIISNLAKYFFPIFLFLLFSDVKEPKTKTNNHYHMDSIYSLDKFMIPLSDQFTFITSLCELHRFWIEIEFYDEQKRKPQREMKMKILICSSNEQRFFFIFFSLSLLIRTNRLLLVICPHYRMWHFIKTNKEHRRIALQNKCIWWGNFFFRPLPNTNSINRFEFMFIHNQTKKKKPRFAGIKKGSVGYRILEFCYQSISRI